MVTIACGPDVNSQPGDIVDVTGKNDPLIVGGFAMIETAMLDPATETRNAGPDDIIAALELLDPADDDDWTAKGKPATGRIRDLTNDPKVSAAAIKYAAPDFVRPE